MITRILPLLNKLLPKNLAVKGLSKIDPRIGKFIANATSAGYAADEALDYLRNQFEPNENQNLRPDQIASQKRLNQSDELKGLAGTALKTGLGVAGIGAIPQVIGNLFQGQEQEQPTAQEQQNIIEQYSPALKQFIDQQIQNGQSPLAAGAIAQQQGKFRNEIEKMTRDHKTTFANIIESIYGQGDQALQGQQQAQQQGQSQGGVDPQLMQIMQGIGSAIKNIRGR